MKTLNSITRMLKGRFILSGLIITFMLGILINSGQSYGRDAGFVIKIKIAFSGYYDISKAEMNYGDNITAILRNADPPYSMIDKKDGLIDCKTLTGKFQFDFKPEGRFYIQILHRNSLEVWSRSGGEEAPDYGLFEYDFTDGADKTYGEVLECSGKHFCLYSGDVNQDGTIDGTDFMLVENDVFGFQSGFYATDLTGDEFVDGADFLIMERYRYYYQIVTPETGLRSVRIDKNTQDKNIISGKTESLNNYPNPFNPETVINYSLNEASRVKVSIYDITGRQVAILVNGLNQAGSHKVVWKANNFPSGTYICILTSNGIIEKKIMNFIK